MTKRKPFIKQGHRTILSGVLCLFALTLMGRPAASAPQNTRSPQHKTVKDDPKKVYLLHADRLQRDPRISADQILTGNVSFLHDGVVMDCDSAHFNEITNSFKAFGNVRMNQHDTLTLEGKYLYYDGMSQLAIVRHDVKLTHKKSVLLTDSLNYDRLAGLGYFFDGGTLLDGDNSLYSDWGEYCPSTAEAVFHFHVNLLSPEFNLTSDTLHYNTRSKEAHIVGPSEIVSKESHIYSENGTYNTGTRQATLLGRSTVVNGAKKMVGDSLYYDKDRQVSQGFGNVVYTDEENQNSLTGDVCYYDQSTGYAWATGHAVVKEYSQPDTLYLHADSLKMYTFHIDTDSMYRQVRAYNKVRAFRTDVQMVCDSAVFTSTDSCLVLYHDPIVWNNNQQLFGEEIQVYFNNKNIDSVLVLRQAFSAERLDSIHYNQLSSREMRSYFKEGELNWSRADGNVLASYYILEKDSFLVGMNHSESTQMRMYMKNRKLEKIWTPAVKGTIYPITGIPPEQVYLPNFNWFGYIRPTSPADIMVWRGKRQGSELKPTRHRGAPIQKLNQIKP